eukprot:scaffold108758_cov30-Tisochrysis_lutea.AAC.3
MAAWRRQQYAGSALDTIIQRVVSGRVASMQGDEHIQLRRNICCSYTTGCIGDQVFDRPLLEFEAMELFSEPPRHALNLVDEGWAQFKPSRLDVPANTIKQGMRRKRQIAPTASYITHTKHRGCIGWLPNQSGQSVDKAIDLS